MRPSEFGRRELAGLAEEAKRQQSSGHDDRVVRLPEKDMRFLRNQQRQNRAMFDRQLSKVCLPDDPFLARAVLPVLHAHDWPVHRTKNIQFAT